MSEQFVDIPMPVRATEVPERREPPVGDVEVEIVSFSRKPATDEELDAENKLRLLVQLKITGPEGPWVNSPHTHGYTFGTDTDPGAKQSSTWAYNGFIMDFFNMLKMFGVTVSDQLNLGQMQQAAIGQRAIAEIRRQKSKNPRFNNLPGVVRFHKLGTRVPKVDEKTTIEVSVPPQEVKSYD